MPRPSHSALLYLLCWAFTLSLDLADEESSKLANNPKIIQEQTRDILQQLPLKDPTDPFLSTVTDGQPSDTSSVHEPKIPQLDKTEFQSAQMSVLDANAKAPQTYTSTKVPDGSCDTSRDRVYLHRFVSSVLSEMSDKVSPDGRYDAQLHLDLTERSRLREFHNGHQTSVYDAVDIIVDSLFYIQPHSSADKHDGDLLSWLAHHQSKVATLTLISLIVLINTLFLFILMDVWRRTGGRRFILFIGLLCFCVSVPWTWVHLYKQNMAERIKRMNHDFSTMPQCDPTRLSWSQFIFTDYSRTCDKYYEDLIVDPLWEVKPTQAIATTFVELFWEPLRVMGKPVGVFVRDVLDPVAWYLKPVVAVLGLVFLWWVIVLMSGMRVWTWFFTVEPAITTQHQIDAINETVRALRDSVQQTSEASRLRESQLSSRAEELIAIESTVHDMRAESNNTHHLMVDRLLPLLSTLEARHCTPVKAIQADVGGGDSAGTESARHAVITITRFDHIVLTTNHVSRILEFYVKLGMQVKTFKENRKALHFGQFKMNIHESDQVISPRSARPTVGSLDICLVCTNTVEITQDCLQRYNIIIETGPVPRTGACGDITSIYVRDPDNNLVELAHYNHSHVDSLHTNHFT